jgi:NAD-dependent SIR2 family protein deacetylase
MKSNIFVLNGAGFSSAAGMKYVKNPSLNYLKKRN